MKLLLAIAVVLIGTAYATDCPDGPEYVTGKIKFVCDEQGTRPVACLPNGKIGDNELAANGTFSTASFRFLCTAKGPLELSYDVIGCRMPSGSPMEIGGPEEGIPNKGSYQCVKNADGTISRKFKAGCWFNGNGNGKLYTTGQSWDFEDKEKGTKYQIQCQGGNGVFEAKASACLIGKDILQVGSYLQQDKEFFKCAADEKNKWQANYIKVAENEYFEWLQGSFGGEEESAIGDSGSGLTRPPRPDTTTEFYTPTPTFETFRPTPAVTCPNGGRAESCNNDGVTCPTLGFTCIDGFTCCNLNAASTAGVTGGNPFTTTGAPSQGQQCQDLHPICSTLCSTQCASAPSQPPQNNFGTRPPRRPSNTNGKPQGQGQAPVAISMHDDSEPVGFAFERNLFGSFNKQRPTTPKSPNRFAINMIQGGSNNKPQGFQSFQGFQQQSGSTGRPSKPSGGFGGFGSSGGNWGSHHGGSWGGSSSWWQGGSQGGSQGGFNGGSKPSGSMVIIGGGKPSGGRPGFGGWGSSSSSSSSSEGGHFGGHFGHGHGQGQGQQGGAGFKPTGRPSNGPVGHGPPGGPGCFDLASSVQELINAMCPKSCGVCGQQVDLKAAASKYSSSKCVAREPSIGLELDFSDVESPASPAPTQAPVKPSGGRPSKPGRKPSKNKSSKNKSGRKGKKNSG